MLDKVGLLLAYADRRAFGKVKECGILRPGRVAYVGVDREREHE